MSQRNRGRRKRRHSDEPPTPQNIDTETLSQPKKRAKFSQTSPSSQKIKPAAVRRSPRKKKRKANENPDERPKKKLKSRARDKKRKA